MIGSAGISILTLALFDTNLRNITLSDFRPVEFIIFAVCLFLLRKYQEKMSAVKIILGSGIAGTAAYLILGALPL